MITTRHRPETIWNRYNFPFSMEGCVLYLPLWQEDMQGSTLLSYDRSVTACSVTGATYGYQGRTFNGTSDYISCGNSSIFDITQALTMIAWVKFDAAGLNGTRCIIDKEGSFDGYGLLAVDGAVKGFIGDNVAFFYSPDTGALSADTLYHIGVVYNRTDVRLYLNGVLTGTPTASTGAIDTNTNNVAIGSYYDGSQLYHDGLIGEVLIANRAYSAGEMMNHRLATKWRFS